MRRSHRGSQPSQPRRSASPSPLSRSPSRMLSSNQSIGTPVGRGAQPPSGGFSLSGLFSRPTHTHLDWTTTAHDDTRHSLVGGFLEGGPAAQPLCFRSSCSLAARYCCTATGTLGPLLRGLPFVVTRRSLASGCDCGPPAKQGTRRHSVQGTPEDHKIRHTHTHTPVVDTCEHLLFCL
jgi:hypothetical protein